MSAKSFADTVTEEFDNIDWDNTPVDAFRDVSFEALANGIEAYILNEDNSIVECTATGTITPPTPPSPYTGSAEVEFTFPPASTLLTLLEANIGSDTEAGDISGLFDSIAQWLATVVATLTGWSEEDVGTLAGVGTLSFPNMSAQATPAKAEMQATAPTTREDAWIIIEKYIILGLTGGVIVVPLPLAVGTVGSAAFTGSASGSVNYH